MTKRKQTIEQRLLRSMKQAVEIHQGKASAAKSHTITAREATSTPAPHFDKARIVQLRERLGLSQAVFAGALNVGVRTAQSWEQGLRVPEGPAMRLMEIAEKQPAVLLRYVRETGVGKRER
ncbi:MAG: helix-turn-helix domain-containing protein [Gemmatimonadaceae bacterium]|nr:helix-turn-helix domain-containing protein [Gemmatimonadaceae bacterium]